MDLKDLQKTWGQLSAGKTLDENQIRVLLRHRTSSLIDRINRNIRIGFVVLFVLIAFIVADDLIFVPLFSKSRDSGISMPQWMFIITLLSYLFIISAFIYFAVKYYLIRKSCDITCNLKGTIKRIIGILHIYQRMFYLTLFIFAIVLALQFLLGVQTGIMRELETYGVQVSQIALNQWFTVGIAGLLVLVLSVGGIFFLMQWGFRRLYGNYIGKLKEMLKELNEQEALNET